MKPPRKQVWPHLYLSPVLGNVAITYPGTGPVDFYSKYAGAWRLAEYKKKFFEKNWRFICELKPEAKGRNK